MNTFLRFLFATINVILFAMISLICATLVYVGGVLLLLTPFRQPRWHLTKLLLNMPALWSQAVNGLLFMATRHKWIIQRHASLDRNQWYVLISNHQTWADISVLGYVLSQHIPVFKFFMKKQLLWGLPFIGVATWILGYPFMARHTREQIRKNPKLKGKDVEIAKRCCRKFLEHPTTVINFVEGTRFTMEKHERQHSPFKHLLKPKAGGVAIVINELQEKLAGIINVTIRYTESNMTFWKLLSGNFEKIIVTYDFIPVTEALYGDYYKDRQFRSHFQQWLNGVWQEKDDSLDKPLKTS